MKKIINQIQKSILMIFVFSLSITMNFAAPYHGTPQQFSQPDGTQITLYLYGDEYYMRAETSDGYTVIRDESTGWICYAILSEDKTKLVSTGIPYKGESQNNLRVSDINIEKNIDIDAVARQNVAKANRLKLEGVNEVPSSHTNNKRIAIEKLPTPASPKTIEHIKGLTILVDFSDAPASVSKSEVENMLNGDNYNANGNNGSVKEFYHDISGGLLVYENVVFGYYRAPKTFAEYDAMEYTLGLHEIMKSALQWIENSGFDFSTLTLQNGKIQAINVIHTGVPQNWAKGMWYHQGWYDGDGFSADGVGIMKYNTSPAYAPLKIATICHENGHMIGNWPDTYKYDGKVDGIGPFDLMCKAVGEFGTNPSLPNPYFLFTRGWATIVDVTDSNTVIKDSSNTNTIYKYRSKSPTEYYLIKARLKKGRSTTLTDEGLTIWHIDENGDNQTDHHQVFLEHANNLINNNIGTCWKKGVYEEFNDFTLPSAKWYDDSESGLMIWNVGTPGDVLTYNLSNRKFLIDCNGDLGGSAFIDKCKVCSGGNTGILNNSTCVLYCEGKGSIYTDSSYITSVTFGNINNNTGKDYYSDYTNLSQSYAPCEKINITVKIKSSSQKETCYAWIDWNKNQVFDDNERINFPTYKNRSTTAIVTVPAYAKGKYIMRVRSMEYISTPTPTPCNNFYPGEVEDYSIEILDFCKDCNNDLGGTASIDNCKVCSGGNTGIEPNTTCTLYCEAIGYPFKEFNYISSVSFGNINNITGNDNYSDFTNLSYKFTPCQKIGISVKLKEANSTDFCFAWIDWNNNGVFEEDERTDFPAYQNNSTIAEIAIPANVVGKFTMRIINEYFFKLPYVATPCGSKHYGEVEDYSIEIAENCTDCNGDLGGTALLDKCNICVGGNTGKTECVVSSLTNDESDNFSAKIFPNPSSGKFSIEYNSNKNETISVKLISTLGQVCYSKNYSLTQGSNLISIGNESLSKGIYLVVLENEDGEKISKKIIVN